MNQRKKLAAMHARELRYAKDALMTSINRQIQSFKRDGYEAQVTPQILTLLNTQNYRKRDVQKINRLVANPDKLKDYILASNAETGEIVSGKKAIERYNRYATSKIRKPAKQMDVMIDNVVDSVADSFVDESVLNEFTDLLQSIAFNPNTVSEDWWQLAHPNWYEHGYRGNIEYAKRQSVTGNSSNIIEMRNALTHLVDVEGAQSVADRISSNYESLQESAIIASIGYKNNAASALQSVLKILLPSGVHSSAMYGRVSDMQSAIEGQYDYEDYEE